jgi:hypothetical protein
VRNAFAFITSLVLVVLSGSTALAAEPDFMQTPEWLGQQYAGMGQWQQLDGLVERLARSGERSEDGRFQLYLLAGGIEDWFSHWDQEQDRNFQQNFADYRKAVPGSAFAPVLAAMQVHSAAWRARGTGYSGTVTREGWALFRERNEHAWKMMKACKQGSDRLPVWYDQAIKIAGDADAPQSEQDALFKEGSERFPGYHSIYFTYLRQFSPLWGGSYEAADDFIRARVAAKTNPDGEALYARLYWLLDQLGNGDADFFVESQVDWTRMRAGFEVLLRQFPGSAWNHASFTAYACRANDATTYWKLRGKVDAGHFRRAAPEGISLEVCDERFTTRS